MKLLVTGGTGTLGRELVPLLRAAGHNVRVMSRRASDVEGVVQGDLITGLGLAAAVAGVEAILHAASATTQLTKGHAIDVLGTQKLTAAARTSTVRHLALVSIVGIDKVKYPYYQAKLGAEAAVMAGGVPWTILRATQFHDLIEFGLATLGRTPALLPVPVRWQFQPVDKKEVARRLAEVIAGPPAGRLPDFGGPEVRSFRSLAESWLQARGRSRRIVNLWLPFKGSSQVAAGNLLCPAHKDGTLTFEQYLASKKP